MSDFFTINPAYRKQSTPKLVEANGESWRRFDEALEDVNRKLLRYFLPSNPSREKIDGMEQLEEMVQSLQRKEDELRKLATDALRYTAAHLRSKADGVRLAREDLQALIKRMSETSDLRQLEGEDIRTCPVDGCILPSEIHRIKQKYGVQLSGAYNFAQTRELRLANGAKLVF